MLFTERFGYGNDSAINVTRPQIQRILRTSPAAVGLKIRGTNCWSRWHWGGEERGRKNGLAQERILKLDYSLLVSLAQNFSRAKVHNVDFWTVTCPLRLHALAKTSWVSRFANNIFFLTHAQFNLKNGKKPFVMVLWPKYDPALRATKKEIQLRYKFHES